MTGLVVSVLVTVLLASSGNATPTEDIEGYFKDLRKDVMQRFDGLEKSNEALLKELHQFEDAIGPEAKAKAKANRNQGAGCEDHSHSCSKFAKRGYCKKKADKMLKKCPKSCNACTNVTTLLPAQETTKSSTDAGCVDRSHGCPRFAKKGLCEKNDHVVKKCPKSCNACMDVTTQLPAQETTTSSTGAGCEDHSRSCSKFAKRGYCKKKADRMLKKCPKSCNACVNVTTPLPAQETTSSSTDAGCVDHSHRCPRYAKKGYCEKNDHVVKKCPKSCNACMNVTTQLPAQETTTSSTGAGCEDRSRICSIYAKKGYCNKKGDELLKLCPKSCNACMNVTTLLPAQETSSSTVSLPPAKGRRHRTNEAFLSIDPASDSDTEQTRQRLNIRHRTPKASIAIDPVPKRPQPRKTKGRRHRTKDAFLSIDPASDSDTERTRSNLNTRHRAREASIAIDPVPKRPQQRKTKGRRHRTNEAFLSIDPASDSDTEQTRSKFNLRHRARQPSIAIDPVPERPQPRKNRRHRTNEAFLSVDPASDSDTEHQQPRFTKPHYTRKAADQVRKRPQRRNRILNERVHVSKGKPEVDLEQHRLVTF